MEYSQEQSGIRDWFNNTYKTKGERYLRPVKGYYVFPNIVNLQADEKLLDVACGLGRLLEASKTSNAKLHGIDIAEVAIEKARTQLPLADLRIGTAESMPFDDNYFDVITCLGALERMINLEQVLAEMHRIGHAGTRYCFLVRNANTFMWRFFKEKLGMRNDEGHQGAKTLDAWQQIFAAAGFKIESVLPDQYPLHKRKKWLSLGLAEVNYHEIQPGVGPLEKANEFIFVLKQA